MCGDKHFHFLLSKSNNFYKLFENKVIYDYFVIN